MLKIFRELKKKKQKIPYSLEIYLRYFKYKNDELTPKRKKN